MKEREIPELLLKCCNKIHKAYSIKVLNDCVKITFYCSTCRNWLYLEIKNGMKKMMKDIIPIKHPQKLPYKYVKANHRFADEKSDDFPKGDDINGEKRNKKTIK